MATLVCFHAHPDDESIATGGAMAMAAANGHRVVLVLATGGEHGQVPAELAESETLAMRRAAETARYRALVFERLKRIGIPDIESRIRYEKILTPTGWEHDLQIYRGATFNLAHNLAQMLHFRPRNRFEDLDGVYLVGGGTHPGSGLPVIFESARITTRLMAQDLGLTPDWEQPSAMSSDHYIPAIAEAL